MTNYNHLDDKLRADLILGVIVTYHDIMAFRLLFTNIRFKVLHKYVDNVSGYFYECKTY
jgi:hypothetical protein